MSQVKAAPEDRRPWIPGLPKGPLTKEMLRDFEACFTAGGGKWHRRREVPLPDVEVERIFAGGAKVLS